MEKPGEGKYFRELLDGAPDAMLVIDEGGVILRSNRRTEELFGYDRHDLVGHRVELLVPKRFRGDHMGERERFSRAPRLRPMGERTGTVALRRDGSEFPADISLSPVTVDGNLRIVVAVRDMTDWRKQEETTAALQMRLEEAEAEITLLRSLIPVCSRCGRPRDEAETRAELEAAVQDGKLTPSPHGPFCAECSSEFGPGGEF